MQKGFFFFFSHCGRLVIRIALMFFILRFLILLDTVGSRAKCAEASQVWGKHVQPQRPITSFDVNFTWVNGWSASPSIWRNKHELPHSYYNLSGDLKMEIITAETLDNSAKDNLRMCTDTHKRCVTVDLIRAWWLYPISLFLWLHILVIEDWALI